MTRKSASAVPAKKKSTRKTGTTSRKTVAGAAAARVAEKVPEGPSVFPRRRRARNSAAVLAINPEERHQMIQIAAYHIAERRGFHGGSAHEDWLQAEQEVDAMIAARKRA